MEHGSPEMYQFTHLIVEADSKFSPNLKPYMDTHDILDSVEAFHQTKFNLSVFPPIKIETRPALFLLKRKNNYLKIKPNLFRIKKKKLDEIEEVTITDG